MGIDVIVQDENGKPMQTVLDPCYCLTTALAVRSNENSACLRFVDPYGDTVFNRLQSPVLVAELKALRSCITDAALRDLRTARLESAKKLGWAPRVLQELEQQVADARAEPIIAHLDVVLKVLDDHIGPPHIYVLFQGD